MRYIAFKVKTACAHCGNPLVINGPLKKPLCTACNAITKLSPGAWASIMGDGEKESLTMEKGEGYNTTSMTGRGTFETQYVKADATCSDCEQEWDLDAVATGTDGHFLCTKCGHKSTTYPAPDWLKTVIPTATQVFFGEREADAEQGQASAALNEESDKPLVFSCPQCSGALKLTAASERTVPCTFCGVDVYLPDGLWAKLHPAKKAKFWVVRFEGDYAAAKKTMKERKKAAKAAKAAQ